LTGEKARCFHAHESHVKRFKLITVLFAEIKSLGVAIIFFREIARYVTHQPPILSDFPFYIDMRGPHSHMRERKLTADCKYIVVAAWRGPAQKAASVNLLFVKSVIKNEILSLFCDAPVDACGQVEKAACAPARSSRCTEESFPISVSAVKTDGMDNNWPLALNAARTYLNPVISLLRKLCAPFPFSLIKSERLFNYIGRKERNHGLKIDSYLLVNEFG
jgi:hypothetical protein